MTEAPQNPLYPQYCFHLSPTINKWCPLRAGDIEALSSLKDFEGQGVFFHLNHPIKWVRIAGVVVAIDEYASGEHARRHVYTVDDSSGTNIECLITVPVVKAPDALDGKAKATAAAAAAAAEAANQQSGIPPGLDVGHVVLVKGGLSTFRDHMQIKVEKMILLRSTEEEVNFWEKIQQFRDDVLAHPWNLDRKTVRMCKREAEGILDEDREARKRKKDRETRSPRPTAPRTAIITGLEKRTRPRMVHVPTEGKYEALGL